MTWGVGKDFFESSVNVKGRNEVGAAITRFIFGITKKRQANLTEGVTEGVTEGTGQSFTYRLPFLSAAVDKNLSRYYNVYMKKSTTGNRQAQKYEMLSDFFQGTNGYARSNELKDQGFHQRDIKWMTKDGTLLKIKNGLFRYAQTPLVSNQGFIDISLSVPNGVICLLSALSYYELTTFNPSFISVALVRNTWPPQVEYPPVEFFYFSKKLFESGIDRVKIGGSYVRIYCPEKTVCDCFRLRHKLGLDIAREGLMEYLKMKNRNIEKLLKYAEICRVKSVITPWLQALV